MTRSAKFTNEYFIEKFKTIHGDTYSYDRFEFNGNDIDSIITCKVHGDYLQKPIYHSNKNGCPKCARQNQNNNRRMTAEKFKLEAALVHNNYYIYDLVLEILSIKDKVNIICPEHGIFIQTVDNHLNNHKCKKCATLTTAKFLIKTSFVEEANLKHNNYYSYLKFIYKNNRTKGIITCPVHGDFEQIPKDHLSGSGCKKCSFKSSKPEIKWLNYLDIKEENRQISLFGLSKKIKVDGFDPETNTVYQFHGDYWHGNPKIFNWNDTNKTVKKTFKELYDNTIFRENQIKEAGYNLVVMWESDFNIK